jgi:hypothetical protein
VPGPDRRLRPGLRGLPRVRARQGGRRRGGHRRVRARPPTSRRPSTGRPSARRATAMARCSSSTRSRTPWGAQAPCSRARTSESCPTSW